MKVNTNNLPWVDVTGAPEIKKRVFFKNGIVPKITNFSEAIFAPGQSVKTHKHDTMYEIFYITYGKAKFVIEEETLVVGKGDCVIIEGGKMHSQENPYETDVHWLYFGVATD